MDDCFKTRTRNADYALEDDELFSEEPFYYMNDGYDGFSDYTTLPSDYVEGGMMPYAVAIHLSYKKDEDRLNVHHLFLTVMRAIPMSEVNFMRRPAR